MRSLETYLAGRPITEIPAADARELAAYLSRKHADVFTNPRHPDHTQLSADVRALHEHAAGPDGALPV